MRLLIGTLLLHGIAALGGGAAMIVDPSGGVLGWDTSMLASTPLTSYLIPGVVLAVGLGVSALVLALGVHTRSAWPMLSAVARTTGRHWSWAGSIGLGAGVIAWIVVQLVLVGFVTWLQPLVFLVGVVLAGMPWAPSVRNDLR